MCYLCQIAQEWSTRGRCTLADDVVHACICRMPEERQAAATSNGAADQHSAG